jgi:hypothetical protein
MLKNPYKPLENKGNIIRYKINIAEIGPILTNSWFVALYLICPTKIKGPIISCGTSCGTFLDKLRVAGRSLIC